MSKAPGGRGERELKVRLRTGKNRSLASKLWLERQLNDPYVVRAKRDGLRSRAAYKLTEIDDKRRRVKLKTQCVNGDKVVIDGEALVLVPRRDAA